MRIIAGNHEFGIVQQFAVIRDLFWFESVNLDLIALKFVVRFLDRKYDLANQIHVAFQTRPPVPDNKLYTENELIVGYITTRLQSAEF